MIKFFNGTLGFGLKTLHPADSRQIGLASPFCKQTIVRLGIFSKCRPVKAIQDILKFSLSNEVPLLTKFGRNLNKISAFCGAVT